MKKLLATLKKVGDVFQIAEPILRILGAISGIRLDWLEGRWVAMIDSEKRDQYIRRRIRAFWDHFALKNPEFVITEEIVVPLPDGATVTLEPGSVVIPNSGYNQLVSVRGIVYALRCAATHNKCRHKERKNGRADDPTIAILEDADLVD